MRFRASNRSPASASIPLTIRCFSKPKASRAAGELDPLDRARRGLTTASVTESSARAKLSCTDSRSRRGGSRHRSRRRAGRAPPACGYIRSRRASAATDPSDRRSRRAKRRSRPPRPPHPRDPRLVELHLRIIEKLFLEVVLCSCLLPCQLVPAPQPPRLESSRPTNCAV